MLCPSYLLLFFFTSLCTFVSLKKYVFICFERQRKKQIGRKKEIFYPLFLSSQRLQWPETATLSGSSTGMAKPKGLGHHLLQLRVHFSEKLQSWAESNCFHIGCQNPSSPNNILTAKANTHPLFTFFKDLSIDFESHRERKREKEREGYFSCAGWLPRRGWAKPNPGAMRHPGEFRYPSRGWVRGWEDRTWTGA